MLLKSLKFKRKSNLWPLLAVLLVAAIHPTRLSAKKAYQPQSKPPILEEWRWNLLEELSNVSAFYATQGPNGTIYLPSHNGISIYDGVELKPYPYPKHMPGSFPNGSHVSNTGTTFVSTEDGLRILKEGRWKTIFEYERRMDLRRVTFAETASGVLFARSPAGLLRIENEKVSQIKSTPDGIISITLHEGDLWFTNIYDKNVYRLQLDENDHPLNNTLRSYRIESNSDPHRTVLLNSRLYGLILGNTSTSTGVLRYSADTDTWLPLGSNSPPDNYHDMIAESSDGSIVAYTQSKIIVYKNERWFTVQTDFRLPTSFPFVISLTDGLLVGGYREPIYFVDTSPKTWGSYENIVFQGEDQFRRQWYLDSNGYVIVRNPSSGTWTAYEESDGLIDSPNRIYCSQNNIVWVSGSHQGVAAISRFVEGHWITDLHPETGSLINARSVFESKEGDLIFGCGDTRPLIENDRGGLVIYQPIDGGYETRHIQPPESPSTIRGIVKTEDAIWLGGRRLTNLPIAESNPPTPDEQYGSDRRWIENLNLASNGDIWCTQWGEGILRKSKGSDWQRFSTQDGLPSNHIASLFVNGDESIRTAYAVSEEGLYYFDNQVWSPCILSLPFEVTRNNVSIMHSRDGSIWINHIPVFWQVRRNYPNGDTEADWPKLQTIRWTPQTSTPETRFNHSDQRLFEPANIIVKWDGNTPWSNTPKSKLTYSFRINQGQWSPFTTDNQQILFNLKAGTYELEVRSRGIHGNIDPTPAKQIISVIPPIWKRAWFLSTMLIVFSLIFFLIYMIIKLRIRNIIEIEEFKLRFFTNISHELRSPLTIILGPLESLLERVTDPWITERLKTAHKNASRMLKLVNQLLEFRKLEVSDIISDPTQYDLIQCIKEEIDMIRPLCQEKEQEITFSTNVDAFPVQLDFDKFRMILDNLLTNAVKYTGKHGKIALSLVITQEERTMATLKVQDNGTGIEEDSLPHIFDEFYRVPNTKEPPQKGTGIGLAITKRLADAINGEISVQSSTTPNASGSCFTLQLSIEPPQTLNPILTPTVNEKTEDGATALEGQENDDYILLIVEDDEEICSFLKSELENDFSVRIARDGKEGLALSKSLLPDLIVTDVIMPNMDGKEMCRHIKENELTAHIPIVMLTALKSDEHELKALGVGANEYLHKPIKVNALKKRLQNLMHLRQKLHERFSHELRTSLESKSRLAQESPNERFLNRIEDTVYSEIDNSEFDVELFARKLNMSKISLHRKLKALTGLSPAAFIRNTRLREAAKLLRTGEYNVSEVIHLVGFNDLSHFGSLFKRQFDATPSQYIEQHRST
ncbi:response regulator [Puniceicoccaceae bacterium K14]|nr:response regulator [Puniceicoccaceae bacterium K14]